MFCFGGLISASRGWLGGGGTLPGANEIHFLEAKYRFFPLKILASVSLEISYKLCRNLMMSSLVSCDKFPSLLASFKMLVVVGCKKISFVESK